jgi:hypothetical protein
MTRFDGLLMRNKFHLVCTTLSSRVIFDSLITFSLKFTSSKIMMPIGSGLISIENVLYEQHGGP